MGGAAAGDIACSRSGVGRPVTMTEGPLSPGRGRRQAWEKRDGEGMTCPHRHSAAAHLLSRIIHGLFLLRLLFEFVLRFLSLCLRHLIRLSSCDLSRPTIPRSTVPLLTDR